MKRNVEMAGISPQTCCQPTHGADSARFLGLHTRLLGKPEHGVFAGRKMVKDNVLVLMMLLGHLCISRQQRLLQQFPSASLSSVTKSV